MHLESEAAGNVGPSLDCACVRLASILVEFFELHQRQLEYISHKASKMCQIFYPPERLRPQLCQEYDQCRPTVEQTLPKKKDHG